MQRVLDERAREPDYDLFVPSMHLAGVLDAPDLEPRAGYLGLGAAVLTAIEAVAGIAFFLVRWNEYSDPWLPAVAWGLYVVAAVGVGLSVLTYGERLTGPAFALICVVLACVVTLDFIGIWPEHYIAHTATASMAAPGRVAALSA